MTNKNEINKLIKEGREAALNLHGLVKDAATTRLAWVAYGRALLAGKQLFVDADGNLVGQSWTRSPSALVPTLYGWLTTGTKSNNCWRRRSAALPQRASE